MDEDFSERRPLEETPLAEFRSWSPGVKKRPSSRSPTQTPPPNNDAGCGVNIPGDPSQQISASVGRLIPSPLRLKAQTVT